MNVLTFDFNYDVISPTHLLVQYIHDYITVNKRRGSVENALNRIGCRFINKNDFIVSFLDEFEIVPPTMHIHKHLKVLYETFPFSNIQKVDSCAILCTYLAVVYKENVEINPKKVFCNFCEVFSPCGETIRVGEILNVMHLGCVVFADFMACKEKLISSIGAIKPKFQSHTEDVVGRSIQKSELKIILDENPYLMIHFRESILTKLNVGKRLEMLSSKEVCNESFCM